ncbi:MAG: response regulator [Burkholderiales bacterium]
MPAAFIDPMRGRRIVVIDNDALVLESAGGLIRSWGCDVVTARSGREAHDRHDDVRPDLVIADFHLADGEKGVDAIALLRARFDIRIPAFIVSGDIAEVPRRAAAAAGLLKLDKRMSLLKLRAMATHLILAREPARGAQSE